MVVLVFSYYGVFCLFLGRGVLSSILSRVLDNIFVVGTLVSVGIKSFRFLSVFRGRGWG